ncbi:hypothetical protein ACA910_008236 [Epithemia clementina (nom. ined.)]
MFQATCLLLKAALGSAHPLYRAYHSFMQHFPNQETMYLQWLAVLNLDHDLAKLVQHNQLQLSIWFRHMRVHDRTPLLKAPRFDEVLDSLEMA